MNDMNSLCKNLLQSSSCTHCSDSGPVSGWSAVNRGRTSGCLKSIPGCIFMCSSYEHVWR